MLETPYSARRTQRLTALFRWTIRPGSKKYVRGFELSAPSTDRPRVGCRTVDECCGYTRNILRRSSRPICSRMSSGPSRGESHSSCVRSCIGRFLPSTGSYAFGTDSHGPHTSLIGGRAGVWQVLLSAGDLHQVSYPSCETEMVED